MKTDPCVVLDEDRAFCIHFYKEGPYAIYVNGFQAFATYSKEAVGLGTYRRQISLWPPTGEQNLGERCCCRQVKVGMYNKQKRLSFSTAENGE